MVDSGKKKNGGKRGKRKPENVDEEPRPETIAEDAAAEPLKKKKRNRDASAVDADGKPASKRRLKREKHAQKLAEAEAENHKTVQRQALAYLSLWKHNRAEWKFNKAKQIWLDRHKFETSKVPEEIWDVFVEYFASASGMIKRKVVDDSNGIIERTEKWLENKEDEEAGKKKPAEEAYRRARDLLQNIQV